MADTENRKSVLPSFDGKTPKEIRRDWLRFMADQDLTDDLFVRAEYIRLAIEELILNDGRDAELSSQKNLKQRIATFSVLWDQRRG